MKKALSILLAAALMFAVCVPSFAAAITKDAPDDGSAKVYTTYTTDDETYTVTYDAETPIAWGDAETDVTYKIESQLLSGKTLSVKVSQDNTVMTLEGGTETLAYSLTGDALSYTTKAAVETSEQTFKVNVAQTAWDAASVGTYADTLTYTVSVNPGA